MDIGGTRARIYEFEDGFRKSQLEIELPVVDRSLTDVENGQRRVKAISRLVSYFASKKPVKKIATACAGRKDDFRTGVTLLHFAVPLPDLTKTVEEDTGTSIGPLYDDDVAAAWGHLVSPLSPLGVKPLNTLLLTTGTGLAEAHWIDGQFVDKHSYPRASEFGLEEKLRGDGWKDTGNPCEAIMELVKLRSELYPIQQLILAGRFVHMDRGCIPFLRHNLGIEVHLVDFPEAPALGALQLQGQEAVA